MGLQWDVYHLPTGAGLLPSTVWTWVHHEKWGFGGGSTPMSIDSSEMNINLQAFLGFTFGPGFWPSHSSGFTSETHWRFTMDFCQNWDWIHVCLGSLLDSSHWQKLGFFADINEEWTYNMGTWPLVWIYWLWIHNKWHGLVLVIRKNCSPQATFSKKMVIIPLI